MSNRNGSAGHRPGLAGNRRHVFGIMLCAVSAAVAAVVLASFVQITRVFAAPQRPGGVPASNRKLGADKPLVLKWETPVSSHLGPALRIERGTEGGQRTPPAAGSGLTYTSAPDGAAFTVLFGTGADRKSPALGAELKSSSRENAAQRAVVFRVPVTVPEEQCKAGKRLRGFATDVRFCINKSPDARVSILADLGGVTRIWEWPYGHAVEGKNVIARAEVSDMMVRDSAAYECCFTILVRRRTPNAAAQVHIDSLDIVPKVR